MMPYITDIDYARKRLDCSLVRAKDFLFFVESVGSKSSVIGSKIHKQMHDPLSVGLDDIDIRPITLGYFNVGKTSYYFARKPVRKEWKQGLTAYNLDVFDLSGQKVRHSFAASPSNSVVFSDNTRDSLTFKKALELLSKKSSSEHSLAFHKNWCLGKTFDLYYKTFFVGSLNINNGKPSLLNSFKYLEESFEEVANAGN